MKGEGGPKGLKQLEQALLLAASGSGWLNLEPLNPALLAELEGLLENLPTEAEPSPPASPVPTSVPVLPELKQEAKLAPPPVPPSREGEKQEKVDLSVEGAASLESLHFRIRDCQLCPLHLERSQLVFGQGNPKADLLLVGEGPGEEEDRTGLAFVGKAGQLLTQIIMSIGLNREAVYICNVVKCRPPGNRTPHEAEMAQCLPYLKKQISLVAPKLILTLGNVPTKALLPGAQGITRMRGKLVEYEGIPLLPTFHPSYLLRSPRASEQVWSDLRQVRQILYR